MVIVNRFLVPKGYSAITIFPFIILSSDKILINRRLINHEKIHIRQQLELLIVIFYLWYFAEYLILRIKYKNKFEAYKNISFEKEAYSKQYDLSYLKKRKVLGHLKYI
jgi:hypothetical protein